MLFTAEDTLSTLKVSLATECGELNGKKKQVETEALCSAFSCLGFMFTHSFTVSHPNIKHPWLLLPPVHFTLVTLNNPLNNMDQDSVECCTLLRVLLDFKVHLAFH